MATRKRTSSSSDGDDLPQLRAARSIVRAELEKQAKAGGALLEEAIRSEEELAQVRARRSTWTEFSEEVLKRRFTSQAFAKEFRSAGTVGMIVLGGGTPPLQERVSDLHGEVSARVRKLESIIERLPLCDEPPELSPGVERRPVASHSGGDIFIVHGHDDAAKHSVARVISKVVGREPVILHEQPDRGQTIIEKFETHARQASFAVALLTADDVGRSRTSEELTLRGRQNVILELGYLMGALGRDRVAILYEAGVELPSDLLGVLYVELDDGGSWQLKLCKALREAGVKVDLNRL